MSMMALRYVASLATRNPQDKLVLYELANAHNEETGRCDLSISAISANTGLSSMSVTQALGRLKSGGTLRVVRGNYEFIGLEDAPVPLPANWMPSERAMQRLLEAFPNHNFDPLEFAHDFIDYCARENVNVRPSDRDGAYIRNAAALLERRRPGPAPVELRSGGEKTASIRALIASLR